MCMEEEKPLLQHAHLYYLLINLLVSFKVIIYKWKFAISLSASLKGQKCCLFDIEVQPTCELS